MFGGGTPKESWLLTWSSCSKGKTIAGVETPPAVSETVSNVENQGDNGSHECMSSGGTNLGLFQGIDPRGGAEFDENGPNLTEDVNFVIRTSGTPLLGLRVLKNYKVQEWNQKQERDWK